eukprot:g40820.t1
MFRSRYDGLPSRCVSGLIHARTNLCKQIADRTEGDGGECQGQHHSIFRSTNHLCLVNGQKWKPLCCEAQDPRISQTKIFIIEIIQS